jgi:hypothetical protein
MVKAAWPGFWPMAAWRAACQAQSLEPSFSTRMEPTLLTDDLFINTALFVTGRLFSVSEWAEDIPAHLYLAKH